MELNQQKSKYRTTRPTRPLPQRPIDRAQPRPTPSAVKPAATSASLEKQPQAAAPKKTSRRSLKQRLKYLLRSIKRRCTQLTRRINTTKRRIIFILVLAVVVAGLGGGIYLLRKPKVAPPPPQPVQEGSSELIENLEYQTVLPGGKTIAALGGWKRVSPLTGDPVYAFTDVIGDTQISVSQQPIPDSFIGNVDKKVSELAKNYNATKVLTAGNTKVYIGISTKGPQSTIFVKNNLLILIKSQKKIEDANWIQYINTLN